MPSLVTSSSNTSSGESEEGVVRLVSPTNAATSGKAILDESPVARIHRHRKASRASSTSDAASETVSIMYAKVCLDEG